MHVSLTPELEQAVRLKVESGLCNNSSKVVSEALGLSLKQEADHEWLKREVTLGFAQLEAGETNTMRSAAPSSNWPAQSHDAGTDVCRRRRLRAISQYTLEIWGAEQEEAYLDALWDRFEEITAEPDRWRFIHDLFPECQVAIQGKHVILFRLRGRRLQVVRILHSTMDFPQHIPDEI